MERKGYRKRKEITGRSDLVKILVIGLNVLLFALSLLVTYTHAAKGENVDEKKKGIILIFKSISCKSSEPQ